jgi:NAD(P)-dependent dehydrogenase (short-subunit alcohol dehydrogenase family)
MQGRLVAPLQGRLQAFPGERWKDEFPLAAQAGVQGIETIYESHAQAVNPFSSSAGTERLRALSLEHGIAVESLCADWFMERPLLRRDLSAEGSRKLGWLLRRAAAAGLARVVVPFVDASSLRGPGEAEALVRTLEDLLPTLEELGIELHIESDLEPEAFASLLDRLDHPLIRANYDTGNSASLQEGAHAALCARDAATLEVARAELASDFPDRSIVACAADLGDPRGVANAVGRTVAELGAIDCAVANAGSGVGSTDVSPPLEEWDRVLGANLHPTVLLCQEAAGAMSGGALIVVGSIAGLGHVPAPLPYSVAKAGLVRYTQDLARRLAGSGIRVNMVAPGNVLFPGGRWEQKLQEDADAVRNYIRCEVPLGRFATPEEVASAVVFLCSGRSSFSTGACLVVDGGQLR